MFIEQPKIKEESFMTKALEKKLEDSVSKCKVLDKSSASWNYLFKTVKDRSNPQLNSKRIKVHKRSNSKMTLEGYFNEKYNQGRLTAKDTNKMRSIEQTPRHS